MLQIMQKATFGSALISCCLCCSALVTFSLTSVSSQGWTVEVTPNEVTLGIGASTTIEVKVTIPAGSSATDVTVVTATSQADSTVSDSVTDRTSAGLIFLPMVFH